MVKLSLLAAFSLVAGAFAAPAAGPASADSDEPVMIPIQKRQGYYFQNWSEGGSNIRCANGQGGSYTATWNSRGGFVCGKGWNGNNNRYITSSFPFFSFSFFISFFFFLGSCNNINLPLVLGRFSGPTRS
jgi:endo-1,4-beta-xylanase